MNLYCLLVTLNSMIGFLSSINLAEKSVIQRQRVMENSIVLDYNNDKNLESQGRIRTVRQTRTKANRENRSLTRSEVQQGSGIVSPSSHRQRHSTSQMKEFRRLFKQMNATNATSPTSPTLHTSSEEDESHYATVILENDQLPQYICPEGKWACPKPRRDLVTCINLSKLCDYHIDCPHAEDEEPIQCAFYRQSQLIIAQQQVLIQQLQSNIVQLRHQHSCEIQHVTSQLRDHSHSGSIVHINHQAAPEESCQYDLT